MPPRVYCVTQSILPTVLKALPTDPRGRHRISEDATPEIDIEDFATAHGSALLVDVREPDEYVRGHVPGAVLMPMGQLANRVGEIDRTASVFVICASGNRSSAMTDLLLAGGIDAVSVDGGTGARKRSGRSLEEGPG